MCVPCHRHVFLCSSRQWHLYFLCKLDPMQSNAAYIETCWLNCSHVEYGRGFKSVARRDVGPDHMGGMWLDRRQYSLHMVEMWLHALRRHAGKLGVSAYKCFIHQMSCSEYPVSSFMYPSSLCSVEHFPHESDLGLKTSTVCSYKVSKYHSKIKTSNDPLRSC